MKKALLLVFILLGITAYSQTQTITIPWDFFSVPADDPNFDSGPGVDTDIVIEVGDTVIWDFITGGHNVKSAPGAVETFGTAGGQFDTFGAGHQYSFTFTEEGVNDYICAPHETIMYGSVTVLPEGTLSTTEVEVVDNDFTISPNPGKNSLNIKLTGTNADAKLEVFDVLGKRIYKGNISELESSINVSSWKSGVYLVRISNDQSTLTKRFIKQ